MLLFAVRALLLALLLLVGFSGCSMIVTTDALEKGCEPGTKHCDWIGCVRRDDPAYGCLSTECVPCKSPTATCDKNGCSPE